jgi:hypothetical protein
MRKFDRIGSVLFGGTAETTDWRVLERSPATIENFILDLFGAARRTSWITT